MKLFDHSAGRLADRTALLLTADPGEALLDAARLYDPQVHRWAGRLVFSNGVLLFGPIAVTPKVEQRAGLPAGTAVAWYTGAADQTTSQKRSQDAKVDDGELLVRGLAERLGGTTRPATLQPHLALLASVYSERAPAVEQVTDVLQPYGRAHGRGRAGGQLLPQRQEDLLLHRLLVAAALHRAGSASRARVGAVAAAASLGSARGRPRLARRAGAVPQGRLGSPRAGQRIRRNCAGHDGVHYQ
jgi:hypothetical protein